ncbi:MAG: radical SAM protein [Syntrophomonadaceae bacterium]
MPEEKRWLPLFASPKGEVMELPGLTMLARSGSQWVVPESREMIPLPKGAALVSIPGRIPVGWDGTRPRPIDMSTAGRPAQAVAALLPQGFTRTLLPACVSSGLSTPLPLYGYSAVGFRGGRIWVAAIQTDQHRKWHPRHYNTESLPGRISRMLAKFPENRLVRQLANCSLQYSCYTAQNIFYQRWEGGLPTMASCNADCLGCISQNHLGVDSPQQRLNFRPSITEITELGLEHLTQAREGIISFGQGCEGEPSLNAPDLAAAIHNIRQHTDRGTININTNAGYTEGIIKLCRAGLDSMRVTLFSPREENYALYHRPCNYKLEDVITSICYAHQAGVKVSINLLTMPGFTDREEEIESLLSFVRKYGVDMVQLRNLNIDADLLFGSVGSGGETAGIGALVDVLREELPAVVIGSYTHPVR